MRPRQGERQRESVCVCVKENAMMKMAILALKASLLYLFRCQGVFLNVYSRFSRMLPTTLTRPDVVSSTLWTVSSDFALPEVINYKILNQYRSLTFLVSEL